MTDPYNPQQPDPAKGNDPRGNPPNPYGQNQNPYGQNPNPYGQGQNPYGQNQNPYGQGPNPYEQGPNPYGSSDPYAAQNPYGAANPYPAPSGGFPPAGYPGGPVSPEPAGNNPLAITSLVCGIVGFFCCGVLSVVGLITGFIAMNQIKQTGQRGHGMALAGTIVSGVSLLVGVAFAIYRVNHGGF
jgi:hypothetical protein